MRTKETGTQVPSTVVRCCNGCGDRANDQDPRRASRRRISMIRKKRSSEEGTCPGCDEAAVGGRCLRVEGIEEGRGPRSGLPHQKQKPELRCPCRMFPSSASGRKWNARKSDPDGWTGIHPKTVPPGRRNS